VPDWFFSQSNSFNFQYHRLETDIGLVQKTPFQEDLPATVQKLKKILPFNQSRIAGVAEKIRPRSILSYRAPAILKASKTI
jgi:hypothetical protein